MLIWMCALHCEAKPIIDLYRLKKVNDSTPFDIYRSEQTVCIVSGMGAINMAAATAWAASRFESEKNCWINIGIAGHQSYDIGKVIVARKICQVDMASEITTIPINKSPLQSGTIISQHKENTDYQDNALFDLEAYAFILTASRFSSLKYCQSIKVISDNATMPPERDKARISQLIARSMPKIQQYAVLLQSLSDQQSLQDD